MGLVGCTGFYQVLPGFTGFYRVLLSIQSSVKQEPYSWRIFTSLKSFVQFIRALRGLNGLYRVLPGFTGFYRVFKVLSSTDPKTGELLLL